MRMLPYMQDLFRHMKDALSVANIESVARDLIAKYEMQT